VLVTDSVAVGGDFGGQRVIAYDGAAFLADGTLTGSVLMMDRAVRNVAGLVGADTAIAMASTIPACVLGLDTYGGRGAGGRADLVALDRATLAVAGVWLAGERVA
jgi:N-acetylglucosamine-6-phosphate deacetylase